MPDYLVHSISEQANVIGLACITTNLVDEAAHLHETSRTATAALGRALTGGLLIAALMKRGQRVALKFEGDGPLKKILVEADHKGTARGFVAVPSADAPIKDNKLDVSGVLGNRGYLKVVKDLGLKEPYTGIVSLHSGEIGEDLAHYFVESEQIPSAVGLGVFVQNDGSVSAAGGFLIQTLPAVEEGTVVRLIENIRKVPHITDSLRQGKLPEDMLAEIFSGIPYQILQKRELSLKCNCSRERVQRALIALGRLELQSLIDEQEATEVTCEYCRTTYGFTRKELQDLHQEIAPTAASA